MTTVDYVQKIIITTKSHGIMFLLEGSGGVKEPLRRRFSSVTL